MLNVCSHSCSCRSQQREDGYQSILRNCNGGSNSLEGEEGRFGGTNTILVVHTFNILQIIAVSVGPKAAQETLRSALAIGADRSIHVSTDVRTDQEIQPLAIAKILAHIANKEKADMVLVGKQAIDGDNCQTGPMVAALLGWPQCTFASKVEVNDNEVVADRETDTGSEKIGFQIGFLQSWIPPKLDSSKLFFFPPKLDTSKIENVMSVLGIKEDKVLKLDLN